MPAKQLTSITIVILIKDKLAPLLIYLKLFIKY